MPHSAVKRQVSEGAHYTWSFPGSITVELDLQMVRRLQAQLDQAQEGLLFGHTDGSTTRVADYRAISSKEAAALRTKGTLPRGSDPSPVGYFRVETGAMLQLNEDDVALAKTALPHSDQVILLIQKNESDSPAASFFFWEDGSMFSDFAFLEFPFDADRLAELERARASRGESVHRHEPPQTLAAPGATPRPGRNWPRGAVLAIAGLVALLIGGGLAGSRIITLTRAAIAPAASAPASDLTRGSFGLRVENGDSGALLIKWDRQAEAVVNATGGSLIVRDGEAPRIIPLYGDLVRGGRLIYTPTTSRVELRLTLDRAGQPPSSEMVMVLLAPGRNPETQVIREKRAPAGLHNAPALDADAGVRSSRNRRSAEPAPRPAAAFVPPPVPKAKEALRPDVADVVPDLPPPRLAESAVEKPIAGLGQVAPPPVQKPAAAVPQPAPNPPAPAQPASEAPGAKDPEYRPPTILFRLPPTVPSTFRGRTYKPATVKLTVTLDAAGRIAKMTRDVPPNLDFLAAAAETAIQRWKFKPAQVGARAVPSEIVLNFNFHPLP